MQKIKWKLDDEEEMGTGPVELQSFRNDEIMSAKALGEKFKSQVDLLKSEADALVIMTVEERNQAVEFATKMLTVSKQIKTRMDQLMEAPKQEIKDVKAKGAPLIDVLSGAVEALRKKIKAFQPAVEVVKQKEDFLVFMNSNSGEMNVLHRGKDGGYEWVMPYSK